MKLYQAIVNNEASKRIVASQTCAARDKRIAALLPSGSGFDCGTTLVSASSRRIVFTTSFHHMNVDGYYEAWTHHRVTIRPDFLRGMDISISGPNLNGIKDYIAETFHGVLTRDFEWLNAEYREVQSCAQ